MKLSTLHKDITPRLLSARLASLVVVIAVCGLTQPSTAAGQAADGSIRVATGGAELITHGSAMRRVSVANADVAEAIVVSPTELLLNGKEIGTTSLVIWDATGARTVYPVAVTLDSSALERQFAVLFPEEQIQVEAAGSIIILNGSVTSSTVARRAMEISEAFEVPVVNNMSVPAPFQILLQVRFAEVKRSAMRELGLNIVRVNPLNLRGDNEGAFTTGQKTPLSQNFLNNPPGPEQTFSDAVQFYLFSESANLALFISALQANGQFRSLAEPNLLALDGKEASFLAGGEFPYPVVQGASGNNAVTIVFKEFGVRLNFTPEVTNSGNIHLAVAPEVSTLDFSSGLQVSGFQIPTLLSRRAETEVELRDGQTFAIAGLIDNTMADLTDKVPVLGDIPILGYLFKSQDLRQDRTELLVLVTPRLVRPSDQMPEIPGGEPNTWPWLKELKDAPGQDAVREAEAAEAR